MVDGEVQKNWKIYSLEFKMQYLQRYKYKYVHVHVHSLQLIIHPNSSLIKLKG